MGNQNLSEKLFKPKFNYPETSALIQRVDLSESTFNTLLDGESDSRWYRVLNPLLWHWRCVPILELEETLARIAAVKKKQSNENWLDTVIGYQSGNWIYEFVCRAAEWQKKAEQTASLPMSEENKQKRHQEWLISSQLSSIASYPHYQSDDLASQAQIFAFRAYREALDASPYVLKEIDFKTESCQVKGLLHLPDSPENGPYPVVFMCTGLANLQLDFYRYFADYLAPQGIGLLTIDSPGMGLSRACSLTQNTTILHQAVLEQLDTVPWIDHTKVVVSGFRFGAQMATRLAYMSPNRVKGLLCLSPIVHQLFVDKSLQQQLPAMYKDLLASRLGLNQISNQKLSAELNYFSLKSQGLINRPCSVPVMSVVFENDQLSTKDEAKLITSTKQTKLLNVASSSIQQSLHKALTQSTDWINTLLK